MAKTNKEIEYYRVLRAKMMVKAEMLNVNWARYYANLLDLGGVNNEQYLKNYFNDDNKRFNSEQLITILIDLEDVKEIEIITQCQMQNEVLKAVKEIGSITSEMEKQFDNKDEINSSEASKVLSKARPLLAVVNRFVLRLEETKARN
ncbi:hypothetical protein N5915_04290 [Arcobacter lacus]|uniref:Uncharacterized protein n=1 Tax=Aliarcobacter butzleri L348 TaxID=1447256 RepID=A0A0G9JRD7_9BACT|nr:MULTISPECIES: hypothetical protein [Arcobacteraceae]KLD96725.1 hypothetical protein AA20_11555 [Aliarcobacter butzleri L348]MCT7551963.1 hypothetical protein [Aliarcobacter butzleri]MCT7908770.1 hypothetical protein [Arcobacter lacus]